MRAAKKDENGNVIDVETGEVIVKNGEISADTVPPGSLSASNESVVELPKNGPNEGASTTSMLAPKKKEKNSLPSSFKLNKTKYDVTPDTFFVIRFSLFEKDGIVHAVTEDTEVRDAEPHWVKFRLWNYKEENTWRVSCQEYSLESRAYIMNSNKFNEIKIRNLIRDWSFAEYDEKYRLLHVNGVLSDESYDLFCGLQPSIVFHIIRAMNSYLEA